MAPADVSIRDLEKRWGISRNGLKARARALGVELIRVSSTLTTWPGAFIELGESLHEHLQSGQPMGPFPGLTPGHVDGSAAAATPAELHGDREGPWKSPGAPGGAIRDKGTGASC